MKLMLLVVDEVPEFDRGNEALIDHASVDALNGDYGLQDSATVPDAAKGDVRLRGYRRNAVTLEVETDRQMVPALRALGDDAEELFAILAPWGEAIRAARGYPESGPHDLAAASG